MSTALRLDVGKAASPGVDRAMAMLQVSAQAFRRLSCFQGNAVVLLLGLCRFLHRQPALAPSRLTPRSLLL